MIDGDWHYYTVSIDNDGAVTGKYQVVVYVDGLYELIDASLDSTAYVPTNNLVIGRVSDTSAGYYSGCIDDFRIFDKVLST
ncbi:LamG domain-containing protein [Patescibacteria group bacterium]|nr:LamG domain-containing protein [Patescibacteria group bacterium]